MTSLAATTDAWLAADPDPRTRAAIEANRGSATWVETHFGSVLRFGTAGMRAPSGPGPACMNRVMARVAARAIGRELVDAGLADRGAVVGFDARIGSHAMAFDAARLLAALGIPTAIIDGPAPTPLLARQLLARSAGAGLMVTASHNPRDDNGLKLYWADGTQIRPPIDGRIEARMDLVALPCDADLAALHEVETLDVRSVIAEYVGAAIRSPGLDQSSYSVVARQVVYTALCGVGAQTLGHAFAAAGLPPPIYVEHQCRPDGSFPGLPFPNPEEPGTLDDAIALASQSGINTVLANDPDADRLAVAVADRDGDWHRLSGDELGALLCDWMIGLTGQQRCETPMISASSVVSGQMVQALCKARGVAHHRTLTGFKWIMVPALENPDTRWVFGYEEALGYSVTDAVRDKDGISAAVEFARMTGALAARGTTPLKRLNEIAAEVGLWVTSAVTVRASTKAIDAAMSTLRSAPPAKIAGQCVASISDWLTADTSGRANLIEYQLTPDAADETPATHDVPVRVCVRPSGTEPKAKIYLEAAAPPTGDIRDERRRLQTLLNHVASDVLKLLGLDGDLDNELDSSD